MKKMLGWTLFAALAMAFAVESHAQGGPYQYNSLTPCRIVDTRNASGTNGGPILNGNSQRDFQIRGNCSVPLTAKAVSINITVTGATSASWLALWPSGITKPGVSTINFDATTPALANGAIVAVSSNTNDLSVYNSDGNVNVIIDVTGYFQ